MAQPFHILSLDRGGIMGGFAASALAAFEQATGHRTVEHFDLITGTSTGGIIAIGLAMGATAEEVCCFYETERPTIFPARPGLRKWSGRIRAKAPTLLELTGPMPMSYPAIKHQYRLKGEGSGTRLPLIHRAMGPIPQEHRDGMPEGWEHGIRRIKDLAERKAKRRG
jgi:hypothetical protein